ncbi:hypothetical protein D030_1380A, partial [Vibrio parahaemolyticus AQ3810]
MQSVVEVTGQALHCFEVFTVR